MIATSTPLYIDVIIPLAVRLAYTYHVPSTMADKLQFGIRVEVPFGNKKLYAALVIAVHDKPPKYAAKEVLSVLDEQPIVTQAQVTLWKWMARYYACSLGEVMAAALPSRLKLSSETIIVPGTQIDEQIFDLDDRGYMIAEAVSIQKELSIDKIRDILQIKTVYPVLKHLLELDVISIKEELRHKYQPKQVTGLRLTELFQQVGRAAAFDLVDRSEHQTRALLALIQLTQQQPSVSVKEVINVAQVSHQAIGALEKKSLVEKYPMQVSRIPTFTGDLEGIKSLSPDQQAAIGQIKSGNGKPVMLHGVTGSGKTRIYIELIKEMLDAGRQVLYMLPEIALTTQIVGRLQKVFGDRLLVYHSRLSENERVEVWKRIQGIPHLVLGARSSLFLPFADLGLIIVDEEHDGSYKQSDPNPRYQARDSAIYLSTLHRSTIILGTATPSLESYHNAEQGKYQLVSLPRRYGEVKMPEVVVIDLKKGAKMGHFSRDLLEEMAVTHRNGQQTILFQNRRGFAPVLQCSLCGWNAHCQNCDTTLTYHKYINQMQCHYCAYHEKPALLCPDCGNPELTLKGFGTELIEDDLKIRMPELKIGRLDLDTARGKKRLEQIIASFENKELDVLIGTQMVTKGLHFEHVGLVGIINADQLLHYPDFRATERAFQLMTQVSGRAGRHKKQGRVLIQAFQTTHPVIGEVVRGSYESFFNREISERKKFGFPPFSRLIEVTLKHTNASRVEIAATSLAEFLSRRLGNRVHGPMIPSVARVRNRYLRVMMIKLEKDAAMLQRSKDWLIEAHAMLIKKPGLSTLKMAVDVDP